MSWSVSIFFFLSLVACFCEQVHLGRQEQIRLKKLREQDQLAADLEQARLDRENFLAEEEREREKAMCRRKASGHHQFPMIEFNGFGLTS